MFERKYESLGFSWRRFIPRESRQLPAHANQVSNMVVVTAVELKEYFDRKANAFQSRGELMAVLRHFEQTSHTSKGASCMLKAIIDAATGNFFTIIWSKLMWLASSVRRNPALRPINMDPAPLGKPTEDTAPTVQPAKTPAPSATRPPLRPIRPRPPRPHVDTQMCWIRPSRARILEFMYNLMYSVSFFSTL
ncbi:uncharacterized protein LACBIDRAFT_331796 [Laccaria bicolor S238N-H82]|uniref:Predicted protein n=1 Tax=Laccaria bicolor (strain S238N-H82 / ATCC MYA-4686) TaxID=486041 RepID=B0DQL6_LACBS|nr:uncharacterized protein LACBIDRAFT_331796 [Laccaria bicolor S238N-H82]EDR03139.1 predicted protein [Laccaria bicolor S238N-H82]|eukprot:XP_001886280.1 predicted protein [Laccaria bicolor S238N-H82]